MDRRDFLRTGALAVTGTGLLLARPMTALARDSLTSTSPASGSTVTGASRASRLFPGSGQFVVHSDMHNHSVVARDAVGDPATAYQQMRANGLDVASLTEHAVAGKLLQSFDALCGHSDECGRLQAMDEQEWQYLGPLADANNEDGEFVAIRGFEWTTGTMGHINVWFTQKWTDSWNTATLVTPRGGTQVGALIPGAPPELLEAFENSPETATMDLFYEWLVSDPDRPVLEGGNDGIAGFNHPNSSWGNFNEYQFSAAARQQMVSCEAMNYDEDFFFKGVDRGDGWPLFRVLDAGWRVGLLGVSDEHGATYGNPGLARGGLWVTELTRSGVRAAMEARRMFATFEHGLRLDMAVDGVPMGSSRAITGGQVTVTLDVDAGPAMRGRELVAQVVRPGAGEPLLAHEERFLLRGDAAPPASFVVDVDGGEGDWLFVRVVDPDRPAADDAQGAWDSSGGAVAYSSPVWFTPDGSPPVEEVAPGVFGSVATVLPG